MLDIYTDSGWLPVIDYKDYYTDYEYDGTQVLSFDLHVDSEFLQYIKNEVMIRNEENLYVIKTVNKRKTQCSVTAELYMDEWKENKPYADTHNDSHFQTKSLSELLEYIKPNGWKIINSNIRDIRRTPELKDATQYDVLFSLQETFKVVYEIRNIAKEILVIDPEGSIDRGLYITPELNLDSIEWKGSSNKFCTRLYAYGKDNLTFSSINSGKEYVENNDYTNKLVCLTWRDDRYTVKENLLEDAKKKVNEMAVPLISYSVTINDLAVVNDDYKFLDFRLYDKVHTIIDNHTSILQTIVKYRKYHETPEKNVVTLSSEAQKLTSKIDKISNVFGEDGQKFKGSVLHQAQQAAAELINSWAQKGYIYMTENEIYILDKLPKETAKYCIRINLGGIAFSQQGWQGPYVSAWTIDGKFNADFITTGTLKAINVEGVNIKGGTITGETSINVGTDLTVGDNIYVGQNQDSEYAGRKYINFLKDIGIRFSKIGENGSIRILGKGSASLSNQFGGYNTVVDANIETIYLDVYDSNGQLKNMFHVGKDNTFSSYQITVTSDKRLKENITDTHLEDLIDRVKIKQFDYISGQKNKIGVIAQDFIGDPFEKYVLSQDGNGYYSVDYSVLYLAAVQKVQSLEKRLEALEKRLEEVIK